MATTLLQGARPRGGVRLQDMLIPLPTHSLPAWVIGLIARQHLHHHTSHLLVVGDIPEPIGAQDQDIIRAVLVLREVVNPDLASSRARHKGEGQRRFSLLQPQQEPLGTEQPGSPLGSRTGKA